MQGKEGTRMVKAGLRNGKKGLMRYVNHVLGVIRGHPLSSPALGQCTLNQDSKTCSNCNASAVWRMGRGCFPQPQGAPRQTD